MLKKEEIEIKGLKSDYQPQPIPPRKPLAERLRLEAIHMAGCVGTKEDKLMQLFRVYGKIQMAKELQAITKETYFSLCDLIILKTQELRERKEADECGEH